MIYAYLIVVLILILAILSILKKRESLAEKELLKICRADRGQADSLIAYEMRRKPGISRAEAAKRAAQSYRRDNR